jgi:hypothetical protein
MHLLHYYFSSSPIPSRIWPFLLFDSSSTQHISLKLHIMVNIEDIRASNLAFKESRENYGLVAVFVGATSGIGMGTLKQFAQNANAPRVYILGRSKSAASGLLEEVKASNPKGTFEFIETEVSLIKNVDLACEEIKSKEKKVDILFMSVGFLTLDGRNGAPLLSPA